MSRETGSSGSGSGSGGGSRRNRSDIDEGDGVDSGVDSGDVSTHVPSKFLRDEPASDVAMRTTPGTKFGKYVIVRRLGEGSFSTVWEVTEHRQPDMHFAIKVYRSGDRNARYYRNEVRMLCVIQRYRETAQCAPPLINYYGTFARVIHDDVYPYVHPCIRFELAGDHIGRIIRTGPMTLRCAGAVISQVLSALDFLHTRNIIHTDIKPENVFIRHKYNEDGEMMLDVVLGDLGTATFADSLFSDHIGTVPYLAPETLIDLEYTSAVDIWAVYAMYFELVSGSLLFDIGSECSIKYGDDVEGFISEYEGGSASDDARDGRGDGSRDGEGSEGGSATGSAVSENSIDFHVSSMYHFMLMEKIIGRPPKQFWRLARDFFNCRGRLKENPDITPLTIVEILTAQCGFEQDAALRVQNFVLKGVQYLPELRPHAGDEVEFP